MMKLAISHVNFFMLPSPHRDISYWFYDTGIKKSCLLSGNCTCFHTKLVGLMPCREAIEFIRYVFKMVNKNVGRKHGV